MKYFALATLVALPLIFGFPQSLSAHCEVPCGIYGDQMRFEAMLEDQTTVRKAMTEIQVLSAKDDALSKNQLARWVANKESHATRIQDTIAQYFMTQRIKNDDPKYVGKLTSAHAVMVAAMTCKQQVNPAHADELRGAILKFYEAYEGKKPEVHEGENGK